MPGDGSMMRETLDEIVVLCDFFLEEVVLLDVGVHVLLTDIKQMAEKALNE